MNKPIIDTIAKLVGAGLVVSGAAWATYQVGYFGSNYRSYRKWKRAEAREKTQQEKKK